MIINKSYLNLKQSYVFSVVSQKVKGHTEANPDKKLIRLGIGDVTLPLVPIVTQALSKAVLEMGDAATFRGYGDYQGYLFLREAVCGYYAKKGIEFLPDEIFIGDGAKCDIANILDIFAPNGSALIPNPVYPAYVDASIMSGRQISYTNGNEENGFLPMPNANLKADIIYMCSPNNPTGTTYNHKQLKEWVDYALECDAVILFDSAYEGFVRDKSLPTSIFQIEGAKKCAIEFCSLSKTAGFTGIRCGYTVVPHELIRDGTSLNKLWLRRQTTKFNGVSYITQRGAEAVFSGEGLAQTKIGIDYYMENARLISSTLTELGIWHTGGKNAPFIWLKCPGGMTSWEFFDYLLENAGIVGTPGAGFGTQGEGFFRLSAFGSKENVTEAIKRLKSEVSV
jgi:LL-diaminopimelate aminotransferase